FSPLTSALRHYRQNACHSRRLPATGRCQSVLSATYRIQLLLCDVRSRCALPPYSPDAHAAPNLDQIEKIDYMSDAVGLRTASAAQCTSDMPQRWKVTCLPLPSRKHGWRAPVGGHP